MQSVSQDWVTANTQQFLPLNDVKIFYFVENVTPSSQSFTSTTNWDIGNSVLADTRTKTPIYNKYITLDNNFVLDGSSAPIDNVSSLRGAITLPNAAGTTTSIVYNFSTTVTSLDYMTIKWGEAFGVSPYSVTINSYLNSTLLDTVTHTLNDNEFLSEINVAFTSFNKIQIDIVSAQNYVETRVEQVIFGRYMVFEKKDIIKFTQNNIVEPNSFTLPTHTFEFELDNVNGRFNPDNPSGIYAYLKQGQQVSFIYGLKINNAFEYINGGTFFVLSWDVPQNGISATFKAGSKLDLMTDNFDVSVLGTLPITNKTLEDISISAAAQSGQNIVTTLSVLMHTIKPSIDTETGYRCNDMIQLCANAGCCVIIIKRDGTVNLVFWNNGAITDTTYEINQDVSYNFADYNIRRTLKELIINDENHFTNAWGSGGTIIPFDTEGDVQTVSNPFIDEDPLMITYVVDFIYNTLKYNKIIKGEFRADPRLDVMDKVIVYNKYSNALPVLITTIKYEYNGALKGYYEGIVMQ